jgi:hypothetical protein
LTWQCCVHVNWRLVLMHGSTFPNVLLPSREVVVYDLCFATTLHLNPCCLLAVSFDDLMKSSAAQQQQQQPEGSDPPAEQQQQQEQQQQPEQQVAPAALVGSFKGSASQTRPIPPHVLDQEYDMVHQVSP